MLGAVLRFLQKNDCSIWSGEDVLRKFSNLKRASRSLAKTGYFVVLFQCLFSVWFLGVSFGVPGVDFDVFLELKMVQNLPKF